MKRLSVILLLLLSATSCEKKFTPTWDTNRLYVIEGFLYHKQSSVPISDFSIAATQGGIEYSLDDPFAITDSTGYFRIVYKPTNQKGYINLHPKLDDYSCVFNDIAIVKNLPKGQDLSIGIVHTR